MLILFPPQYLPGSTGDEEDQTFFFFHERKELSLTRYSIHAFYIFNVNL